MEHVPARIARTGSSQPSPVRRQLRAGPLLVTLEEGALRSIRLWHFPQCEVLHGIYAAVRDHNWDTIAPRFLSYEVEEQEEAFLVRFLAEHVAAGIDFVWQGTICGSNTGELVFRFDGQARRTFRKNRIGLCVLHGLELAGNALEIETPAGPQHGVFPLDIAPHQPFKDITAMRYICPPASVDGPEVRMELRFQGELFEMEDQRNWTDASYKTYCTPLSLPYPVELAAGERIVQSVTLRPMSYPAARRRREQTAAHLPGVRVSAHSLGPLPELGFALARHSKPWSSTEIAHLRALRPAHLWVELDLAHSAWEETLLQARTDAALLQSELELAVICDDQGRELGPLFRQITARQVAVARLSCFSRVSHATTRAMLEEARACRAAEGLEMLLGAGSHANFAEFNRAELPLDLADLATYALNPQVHAFDQRSLIETLPVQALTARNAQRIAAGRGLSIGPITFKPRFNAVVSASADQEAADSLPASVDPRQMSLFGAGWTTGSLRSLSGTGAQRLTYFATTGWSGLLEQATIDRPRSQFPHLPGALFPLYHLFADVAAFRQGEVLAIEIDAVYDIEALAICQGPSFLIILANMSGETQSLHVHLPSAVELRARVLDETTVEEAMYAPQRFRSSSRLIQAAANGQVAIDLLPFAIMRLASI